MPIITVGTILRKAIRYGPQRLALYPLGFFSFIPPFVFSPVHYGIPYIAPVLKTSDGFDLCCYLLPQTIDSLSPDFKPPESLDVDEAVFLTPAAGAARATFILFHGNAMNLWELLPIAKKLFKMKCNVLILSYRGYAFSSGTPSEQGLKNDAQAALDYLLGLPYISQVPIILFGHSLGGGVAIDLASRNPSKISALIVCNTFTSVPDIVRTWPLIGYFSFICTQKWRSVDKMRSIPVDTPILMISGRSDMVVPPQLMDRLWQAAKQRGIRHKSPILGALDRLFPSTTHDTKEEEKEAKPRYDKFLKISWGNHATTLECHDIWPAVKHVVKRVGVLANRKPAPPQPSTMGQSDRRWILRDRSVLILDPNAEDEASATQEDATS